MEFVEQRAEGLGNHFGESAPNDVALAECAAKSMNAYAATTKAGALCTVDSKNNVVVNVRITPANVNDVEPIHDILNDVEKRLGHLPKYMGVDAGHHTAAACHQIARRGIQPVVGYRRHTHKGEHFGKYRFRYDPDRNVYVCPEHHLLTWRTTTREGYREYWSHSKDCKGRPGRQQYFGESAARRMVTRHVWQDDLDKADAFTKTPNGKRI